MCPSKTPLKYALMLDLFFLYKIWVSFLAVSLSTSTASVGGLVASWAVP